MVLLHCGAAATDDELIRVYLDRLWSEDWDCPEDAAYDEQ